jgi:hypothetical protein
LKENVMRFGERLLIRRESRPRRATRFDASALLRLLLMAMGRSPVNRRHPVPEPLIDAVHVAGVPGDIRMWGDQHSEVLLRSLLEGMEQAERVYGPDQPTDVLAISGGGFNGAYAAGVLCGWPSQGSRPLFGMVSGVSIGAVIAPFAFLGSAFDDRLQDMTKAVTREGTFRLRSLTQALTGDSLADNTPCARFIGQYLDSDVVKAIAAEHAKGRRLLVATTNLDANRPVIWDLGTIASVGSPEALQLIRQVILASTAVPMFFPPSYVDVECDGGTYDEMHVDGGVTGQVLLYGRALSAWEVLRDRPRPRHVTYYIIRNGKFSSHFEAVSPNLRTIAHRSIKRLVQAQGVGDLWQAHAACQRDGLSFRLAAIPDEVTLPQDTYFDPQVAVRLFECGRARARDGYPWATEPPGLWRVPAQEGIS